ncbi:hypothetical protein PV328_003620 [Microctonus aethiopoides]|uniref:Dynamin-type G domain-containing protein n=1 Tax=Microctonus aethiopoides TaxID=144406 RepID=A0AA39F8T2_9HYME|nr:hypothetical protein PV328_003620 [Microctonus aethiopoides]
MMGTVRLKPLFIVGILFALVAFASEGARGEEELDQVSEVQCRPYIEKALKDLETGPHDENGNDQGDESGSRETKEVGDEQISSQAAESTEEKNEESNEANSSKQTDDNDEDVTSDETTNENVDSNQASEEETQDEKTDEEIAAKSDEDKSNENTETTDTEENVVPNEEDDASSEMKSDETVEIQSNENNTESSNNDEQSVDDAQQSSETDTEETTEDHAEEPADESTDNDTKEDDSNEPEEVVSNDENDNSKVVDDASVEEIKSDEKSVEINADDSIEKVNQDDDDDDNDKNKNDDADDGDKTIEESDNEESREKNVESVENEVVDDDETSNQKSVESTENDIEISRETRSLPDDNNQESGENTSNDTQESGEKDENVTNEDEENDESNETMESTPEEELIEEIEIPENLRPRDHINQILRLDMVNEDREAAVERAASIVLKDLKKLYDTAIQPLETLFKYRDLSNRHFGDPEIFSKPLILFMGPWSGGKSSIINYLLDNEYKPTALRTGAEPSPAYFNILMYGEEEEVLDGTQLAADWTFSGLQKFGQGMLDRLRGLKLKNKLLEKVNIVEIPGILEIRKQVQRLFPFNDACQWFIDRADIIFLVYDPSKLDVGPETEAILDQLKGREYQTRIVLNKADQVKPEELMRVQGALIWNISPLMSSAEPPIMYSTSLWSLPYEAGSPTRLLYAQERAFLRDLRTAIDKRVEHKIASARRFAVRVRNHAKMVDCYLTTYYNHKTFFGSATETSDKIIENPQEYHIYEGLSTLTNISRYDLPDPDVYRDFFRLNKLYDFSLLSSTCTYFRGCPINRLDVAIAYDLPELVGKYKKSVEAAINENNTDGKPPAS